LLWERSFGLLWLPASAVVRRTTNSYRDGAQVRWHVTSSGRLPLVRLAIACCHGAPSAHGFSWRIAKHCSSSRRSRGATQYYRATSRRSSASTWRGCSRSKSLEARLHHRDEL